MEVMWNQRPEIVYLQKSNIDSTPVCRCKVRTPYVAVEGNSVDFTVPSNPTKIAHAYKKGHNGRVTRKTSVAPYPNSNPLKVVNTREMKSHSSHTENLSAHDTNDVSTPQAQQVQKNDDNIYKVLRSRIIYLKPVTTPRSGLRSGIRSGLRSGLRSGDDSSEVSFIRSINRAISSSNTNVVLPTDSNVEVSERYFLRSRNNLKTSKPYSDALNITPRKPLRSNSVEVTDRIRTESIKSLDIGNTSVTTQEQQNGDAKEVEILSEQSNSQRLSHVPTICKLCRAKKDEILGRNDHLNCAPCGHIYCGSCITWFFQNSRRKRCPVCNRITLFRKMRKLKY